VESSTVTPIILSYYIDLSRGFLEKKFGVT
jgi:hypothetical protein